MPPSSGTGAILTSDGTRKDPDLHRHGTLVLSLSSDGNLNVISAHEGKNLATLRHRAIGESVCVAACSISSLIAVAGVTEGEGVLAVHRMFDSSTVRLQ